MLSKETFISLFFSEIAHTPTAGQSEAVYRITQFLYKREPRQLFILKGYAGTGKTTVLSALVKTFAKLQKKTVLLSPTGRAAKVFSSYSDSPAFTIHKYLYKLSESEEGFSFQRRIRAPKNTLFIVDEASMLSDLQVSTGHWQSLSILRDLINFVFEGENNKLLFIGDDAQLPPVFLDESPALQSDYLQSAFQLDISEFQLTDVVRQASDSGILHNATLLRNHIAEQEFSLPLFSGKHFPDIHLITGMDLEETLNSLYSKFSPEEILIITRSNKRANMFNQEIRNRIFFLENQIAAGDYLMVTKNNYRWVEEKSKVGFLANGEMMEVLSVNKTEERYGFTFADLSIRLCDYDDYPTIEIKIILDSLNSEAPSLSDEQNKRLYAEVSEDYADITHRGIKALKMREDPFLNAVQAKFAYSLTCHKTQGGQWKNTMIDFNYFSEEQINKDGLRWLYTAFTRATENVYLINFGKEFFLEEE